MGDERTRAPVKGRRGGLQNAKLPVERREPSARAKSRARAILRTRELPQHQRKAGEERDESDSPPLAAVHAMGTTPTQEEYKPLGQKLYCKNCSAYCDH